MGKLGLIQINSGRDALTNLAVLESKLRQLHAQGVTLVLTPENTLVFGKVEDYQRYAESLNSGPLQKKLSQLAINFNMWLIVGSFPIRTEKGISATCLVYDNKGELVAHYEKLHLFDASINDSYAAYQESAVFNNGDKLKVIDSPFGQLGLSICYDLRFPELYRALRAMDAKILLVPAAFTQVTGKAHWQVLLQARAIENQCWVVAAAQCGSHQGGRDTYGHSMIIDPWGQVVAKLGNKIGTLWVDIDPSYLNRIRHKMPVQQHAKLHSFLK